MTHFHRLSDRSLFAVSVVLAVLAACTTPTTRADIHRFTPSQSGTRNLGVWRLTNDAVVRDYGNYHNIQCWSHNGRFTCYTRFARADREVHVVDLSTGEDRLLGPGRDPRWANHRNWLFYVHDKVMRYDADTGEHVVIAQGMSVPGGLDSSDTWLYGTVEQGRGYLTVRTRTEPGSEVTPIKPVPSQNGLVNPNPRYPVIMVRSGNNSRAYYDLDGSNVRPAHDPQVEDDAHTCWSGDGKFLLFGNRQVAGRYWNKPFPSDLEILCAGGSGDISPFDKAGRYYCGTELVCMDTRSGDAWQVVSPQSYAIIPMDGDHSTATDIDPKGSPDGTKIHYHSNRDIESLMWAKTTDVLPKDTNVIPVESTQGFPESGDLVFRTEVVGYTHKTATTFEGIERRKYGTRPGKRWARGGPFYPLSAYVLSDAQRARAEPDHEMLKAGFPADFPLLYQRQTDCYIVVTRLPFRPHLRLNDGVVQLIPGEHHWETRGYRVLHDGEPIDKKLLHAGDSFELTRSGKYTAAAVEWSGLKSPPSLPLHIERATSGKVLQRVPDNFSWTRHRWTVQAKGVDSHQAASAPQATMELVHLHDGVIAREQWHAGSRVSRVDFNEEGKPIRHQYFKNGKLQRRVFVNVHGLRVSDEHYGEDGFKTQYVKYYASPRHHDGIDRHWWFDRGRPIKYVESGKVVFDVSGSKQPVSEE